MHHQSFLDTATVSIAPGFLARATPEAYEAASGWLCISVPLFPLIQLNILTVILTLLVPSSTLVSTASSITASSSPSAPVPTLVLTITPSTGLALMHHLVLVLMAVQSCLAQTITSALVLTTGSLDVLGAQSLAPIHTALMPT